MIVGSHGTAFKIGKESFSLTTLGNFSSLAHIHERGWGLFVFGLAERVQSVRVRPLFWERARALHHRPLSCEKERGKHGPDPDPPHNQKTKQTQNKIKHLSGLGRVLKKGPFKF